MSIDIRVPATLSNLGPGFDVLGLAIERYNEFAFEPARGWRDGDRDCDPGDHLVFRTILRACSRFGGHVEGLHLVQHERVPRSRGLGSSATARVAGLLCWQRVTDIPISLEEALQFLAGEEGHPDNVVAAMVGGLTATAPDATRFFWTRHDLTERLQIAVCVPTVEVSTDAARAILPSGLSREDAVFNLRRLALLLSGLLLGDADALRHGVRDRLHHRFRAQLVGPVDDAIAAAESAGAAGAFLSGSGSALAAFVLDPDVDPEDVGRAMAQVFPGSEVFSTRPEATGAWDGNRS